MRFWDLVYDSSERSGSRECQREFRSLAGQKYIFQKIVQAFELRSMFSSSQECKSHELLSPMTCWRCIQGENMQIRMASRTTFFNPVRFSCNRSSNFMAVALMALMSSLLALQIIDALSGKLDCCIKFNNLKLILSQMYVLMRWSAPSAK